MDWLQAIVLGVVQGLTEFLPISSSAHQSIVGRFFGEDPGSAFTAITQLGTEAAVLVYFRKDIAGIIRSWCLAVAGKLAHTGVVVVARLRTAVRATCGSVAGFARGAFGRCVSLRRCTVHSLSLVKSACEAQYWEGQNVRLKRERYNER